MAVDKCILRTLAKGKFPTIGPPPAHGGIDPLQDGPEGLVSSLWGLGGCIKMGTRGRTSVGRNKELPGFNYAPAPVLGRVTDSSLPCCHFGRWNLISQMGSKSICPSTAAEPA